MEEHWQSWLKTPGCALAEPAVLERPSNAEALRIFDVRQVCVPKTLSALLG
jgi:hypothetical protein